VINQEHFDKVYKQSKERQEEWDKLAQEEADRDPFNKIEALETELAKYKAAIGYFQREGDQSTKDIIRNLLSY
jgi:hypothetical protein